MASQNAKRRSRKSRGRPNAPRAVASTRREVRAERSATARRSSVDASRMLGTVGERPSSIFGPVPVSEIAIFAGIIGAIVGGVSGAKPALVVGIVVCALGVFEVAAREHFTGFRSHTTLLAAIPAVLVEFAIAEFVGVPGRRILLLLPVVPVFGACFYLLRRSFRSARHTRVTRPPSA